MEMTVDPIDIIIGLSQVGAGYAVARHLFDLGHTGVGRIAAQHDSRSQKRIEGYMQAVKEFGLIPMVVSLHLPSSVPLGRQLLTELLAHCPKVTSVFCGNGNASIT